MKQLQEYEARFTIYCIQCDSVTENDHKCQPAKCAKCGVSEWVKVRFSLDVVCAYCGYLRESVVVVKK